MIKDWIDVARRIETYRLGAQWSDAEPRNAYMFPGVIVRYLEFKPPMKVEHPFGLITEYPSVYSINRKSDPNYPDFIRISGASFGRYAGNVSRFKFRSLVFFWGKHNDGRIDFRCDATSRHGFPSLLEMHNVTAHFDENDVLGDFDYLPALKMGYLHAAWIANDQVGMREHRYRPDGPNTVGFKNYEESWKKGQHKTTRFGCGGAALWWSQDPERNGAMETFAMGARGSVNPLGNQFFEDEEDAFNFMTEFNL